MTSLKPIAANMFFNIKLADDTSSKAFGLYRVSQRVPTSFGYVSQNVTDKKGKNRESLFTF